MSTAAPAAQERAPGVGSSRRIAANFVTLAGTSVLGLLITILISVYVRRILGPSAIGQVSWAMAAVAYLTALVTPGIATVGQRELARDPSRRQTLVALILTVQTLLAAAVYCLLVLIAFLEPRGRTVSLLLLVQGMTLFLTAWNTTWVLQAHERMVSPSVAALAFNALQLPALLLAIEGPEDLLLYAALALPFTFAGVAFNFWYLSRTGLLRPLQLRPKLQGAKRLLQEAWPLALVQAAVLVTVNSGTLVLGFTDGDEAVGQFSSALRLMLVATVITAALWNAYFPALARSSDRPEQAIALSRECLGLLAWMGMPMAALGWAFGRHVVELLYGPAFAPAGHYFEWLCLAIGLMFVNYGVVAPLVPWGRSDLQFKITATAAILNLTVTLAAAHFWGPWGAVAAIIAGELLVLGMGICLRRRLRLYWHPVLPIILPPLLCSATVGAALAALRSSLDQPWWLQLLAATLALGLCVVGFEWRTLTRLARTLRAH